MNSPTISTTKASSEAAAAVNPAITCVNQTCSLMLGGAVGYCPFCGHDQRASVKEALAPQLDPKDDTRAVIHRPPVTPTPPRPPELPSLPPEAAAISKAPRKKFPPALFVLAAGIALFLLFRPAAGGKLLVTTFPVLMADVLIDGKPAGTAGTTIDVSTGPHEIGIAVRGWTAPTQKINLEAKATLNLAFKPVAQPVGLKITADPSDAAIRLDGRAVGRGALDQSVNPGSHTITVQEDGYEPQEFTIAIRPGEEMERKVVLNKRKVQKQTVRGPVGSWSPALQLPAGTALTLAFAGTVRLRLGTEVYLADGHSSLNLGDGLGRSLQVKSLEDHPIDVQVFIKNLH